MVVSDLAISPYPNSRSFVSFFSYFILFILFSSDQLDGLWVLLLFVLVIIIRSIATLYQALWSGYRIEERYIQSQTRQHEITGTKLAKPCPNQRQNSARHPLS